MGIHYLLSLLIFFGQIAPVSAGILSKKQVNDNFESLKKTNSKTPIISLRFGLLPKSDVALIRKKIIKQAALDWERFANVKFVFIEGANSKKVDYTINVYAPGSVLENPNRYGNGGHGFVARDKNEISLTLSVTSSLAELYHVSIHELGHVLGLQHEHQHPDRPFRFDIDFLINACELGSNYCRRSVKYNNELVFKGDEYISTQYDPISIMHYGVSKPIILEDMVISEPRRLSLGDKLIISKTYPGKLSESEIISEHNQENALINAKKVGKCHIRFEGKTKQYEYVYPDASSAHYLERTIEGAYMSARLDPKCETLNSGDMSKL